MKKHLLVLVLFLLFFSGFAGVNALTMTSPMEGQTYTTADVNLEYSVDTITNRSCFYQIDSELEVQVECQNNMFVDLPLFANGNHSIILRFANPNYKTTIHFAVNVPVSTPAIEQIYHHSRTSPPDSFKPYMLSKEQMDDKYKFFDKEIADMMRGVWYYIKSGISRGWRNTGIDGKNGLNGGSMDEFRQNYPENFGF